ncbi:methyl-accepting chemotaxis protein [Pseudomonas sp. S07E 245]|jgi:methyl-accepting chemotaxis protein|uniref:methyl-accepting chemotaxis protein n=2 Tax=Pseudomonas TaxID=286 RepID=UPI000C6EF951|nr:MULTISPECIES: methyl-accepting chemotaxis protein [unclassified Pseudomonas]AUF95192.1 methyl-accepting chemotaxis protein [Pseudomonas sp. 02C 26]QYX55033.1 methyl-accepting chemotaxis protein [Pseudomonas sp. S07E 245]
MNWFHDAKISTKLYVAFALCASITLIVGIIGSQGIGSLSTNLQLVFSNNLVSVAKTAEARSDAIAQNRDLYRLLAASIAGSDAAERSAIVASMNENRQTSERAFAVYRATPLADDERAAGDRMEKDWPAYQAIIERVAATIERGDLAAAKQLMAGEMHQAYRTVMDELEIMVKSNNRQIGEGAQDARDSEAAAKLNLYLGIGASFITALLLGIFISRVISAPIALAVGNAQRIAGGDLSKTIESGHRDEGGQLLAALGAMQSGLKGTIQQIASAADQLASAAEELNAVTEESSRGLIRQNDEIQLAATAVTEMSAAVDEVARNATSTSEASRHTSNEAASGRDQAREAVKAITSVNAEIGQSTVIVDELAGSVRDIAKVLDVIRGIAEQTNLLALNAAIEAARAGEQGRGFAVVADEVRALAARTQASTGEIEAMIASVQSRADDAVKAMGNSRALASNTQELAKATGESLERIAQNIAGINDRNMLIATASEEQANVAREVDRNLVNIQDLSTQTAAGANQTSASSQELSRLAVSFNQLVSTFKL